MSRSKRSPKGDGLQRIIDSGEASEFEVQIYENATDPQAIALGQAKRRNDGQIRRHRRRIANRRKDQKLD